MAVEIWSGICNSADFSGLIDIFHRMVGQVPNFVWLRILHFHRFDIVFLKVCQESLIVFFLQKRFTLKACVEVFDLVQCRVEVVLQRYLWFAGQFDFTSIIISTDGVLQNIKKLFFLFCVNLIRVLLNAICFNIPELLNKIVKSGFICSVCWHIENKCLFLLTCGLLNGGWDTILIFNGEGPTKFSFHTKRLFLIARYNMRRLGECHCVNTEEGADIAIGNIWEMYVTQTVEGITNLIKFKKFSQLQLSGTGCWTFERVQTKLKFMASNTKLNWLLGSMKA